MGDDSESMCMGGGCGDPPSDIEEESTEARRWKSFTSCCSKDNEVDDRVEVGKSSMEPGRKDDIDVIRLMPYVFCRCRARLGPGSLSTVANEMTEMPLGMSDDDMEWSSSYSRRRAFGNRSLSDRQSDRYDDVVDALRK